MRPEDREPAVREPSALARQLREIVDDWSTDAATFKVSWGKAMMWIFIVSDAFIFGIFLAGYAAARMAATQPWPDPAEIFALEFAGTNIPLLLIAIMTFILISSSGTMAIGVAYAYRKNRNLAALFVILTAILGATFVGMQAYEWTDLIGKGYRPWENPTGAPQFGASFFMMTGFHGLHVSIGVIYLVTVAVRLLNGYYDRQDNYEGVEICGLYWHFVDLVWVFIFAFFYLI